MQDRLRTTSEFDQFLLDHFDDEVRRVIPGREGDRLDRENALLQKVGAEAILRALGGPRYYPRWLALAGAAGGLVLLGALWAPSLSRPRSDAATAPGQLSLPGGSRPPDAAATGSPRVGARPSTQGETAAVPPPAASPKPAPAIVQKPIEPSAKAAAKSSCSNGLVITKQADGVRYRSQPLSTAHSYTRGGQLRLLALDGPESGSTLHIATITEAEPSGLVLYVAPRAAPVLPRRACAVPLRDEVQAGRELGKVLDDRTVNIGAGDRVQVGDLYDVLGDPISDATATARPLGRRYIGVIRITATHAAHAEFSRESGQAPAGHFIQAKHSP